MTDRLFLDANVLLELLQQRMKVVEVGEAIKDYQGCSMATSILCIDLVMYFVERDGGDKQVAYNFLASYEVLDMNDTDYAWAQDNDRGDFEDALQVACALRHGCAKLLTLDKELAKNHNKHIAVELIG